VKCGLQFNQTGREVLRKVVVEVVVAEVSAGETHNNMTIKHAV
jgi:hypothetical protein